MKVYEDLAAVFPSLSLSLPGRFWDSLLNFGVPKAHYTEFRGIHLHLLCQALSKPFIFKNTLPSTLGNFCFRFVFDSFLHSLISVLSF